MAEVRELWRCQHCKCLYDTRKEAAECAVSHIHPETWAFGKNKSAFRAFPNCAPGSRGSLEWAVEMAESEEKL